VLEKHRSSVFGPGAASLWTSGSGRRRMPAGPGPGVVPGCCPSGQTIRRRPVGLHWHSGYSGGSSRVQRLVTHFNHPGSPLDWLAGRETPVSGPSMQRGRSYGRSATAVAPFPHGPGGTSVLGRGWVERRREREVHREALLTPPLSWLHGGPRPGRFDSDGARLFFALFFRKWVLPGPTAVHDPSRHRGRPACGSGPTA
jgi:hypothetical protein